MAAQGDDCYFYYYSACAKNDACPFRHQPAALGSEITCSAWLQGNCARPVCKYRHMQLEKNRPAIPCYWENQSNGCLKVHCPFLHVKPRPFASGPVTGLPLQPQPPQSDLAINPNPLLPNSIASVPLLTAPVVSQVFTSHAQMPVAVPHLQPFIDATVPSQIPKNQIDVNAFPQKMLPQTGIADSSFQEHVRMFKEMFSGQGSPKKDSKKRRQRRDGSPGGTSDLEFEQLMDEHEARKKKEKSSFKKDRRDRKDKTLFASKGKPFAGNRFKGKDDGEREEKQSKLDREIDERRKHRETRLRYKQDKERQQKRQQKEKERRKKEKKEKKGKSKDDNLVVSSDEFEVVEDTPEESIDTEEKKVLNSDAQGEAKEANEKISHSVDKEQMENMEKKKGEEFGFHIKTYEEVLREKALRKMLERRQQIQDDRKSPDENPGEGNAESLELHEERDASQEESKIYESSKENKSIAVKSQIIRPVKSDQAIEEAPRHRDNERARSQNSPIQSPNSESTGKSIGSEVRSQIVQVGKEKLPISNDEGIKFKRAMKFGDDGEGLKKVKVVRKVAVTVKPLEKTDAESKKTAKERRSREIYKPPLRGGGNISATANVTAEVNEQMSIKDNAAKVTRVPPLKLQEKSNESQEASISRDNVPESPLKVKTFEEIMEEKRARRQQTQDTNVYEEQIVMPLMNPGENVASRMSASGKPARLARRLNVRTIQAEAKAERKLKADAFRLKKQSMESKVAGPIKDNMYSNRHEQLVNSSGNRPSLKKSTVRNTVKPRILKRPSSKEEMRGEKSTKLSSRDRGERLANSSRSNMKESVRKPQVRRIVSAQPPSRKSIDGKKRSEHDKNFDDLEALIDLNDDIDLDIGVEVEDRPVEELEISKEVNQAVTVTNDKQEQENKPENSPQPIEDIQEAVLAELRKKEDLLSDDELERELESGDFPSLDSGEEIDDDDLLLELEEMINS